MKWALAAIVIVFAAFMAYLKFDTVKTTYVNGLEPYTSLPNREYILEHDCFIFKFKSQDSDWPLIGSRDTVPELPADVKASYVGQDLPGVRILDVLTVGDHFRTVSVRRDQSMRKTAITFEILLSNEASRKYPRLDAFWIMDHAPEKNGAAPRIMTAFAVPTQRD